MRKTHLLGALALVVAGVSASALAEAADAPASGPDLVCKSIPTTGTRLSKRICKTRAQIEEERERAKAMTGKIQHNGNFQVMSDRPRGNGPAPLR
jgi:hypothetical protein